MSKYVNEVKKNEDVYDIQDKRIPEASIEDADKVLKVNAEGQFELGDAGGGTQLYHHVVIKQGDIDLGDGPIPVTVKFEFDSANSNQITTLNDLANELDLLSAGFDGENKEIPNKFVRVSHSYYKEYAVMLGAGLGGTSIDFILVISKANGNVDYWNDYMPGGAACTDTVTAL